MKTRGVHCMLHSVCYKSTRVYSINQYLSGVDTALTIPVTSQELH